MDKPSRICLRENLLATDENLSEFDSESFSFLHEISPSPRSNENPAADSPMSIKNLKKELDVSNQRRRSLSTPRNKGFSDHDVLTSLNKQYLDYCLAFKVSVDADISIALQQDLEILRLGSDFDKKSLLPLGEVLKSNSCRVRVLDFRRTKIYSSGAYVIQNILKFNKSIEEINLHGNHIGDNGAKAIADGITHNKTLKSLIFRRNAISAIGVEYLIDAIKCKGNFTHLDVSSNTIEIFAIHKLRLMEKELADRKFTIAVDGTQPYAEIANSVTHGFGMILMIVGGILLMVASFGIDRKFGAVSIYCLSVLIMFTCSTLCHGFYSMRRTQNIFIKLDYSSIYLLIAGSYTPFVTVNLGDVWIGPVIAVIIWILAILGVYIGVSGHPRLSKIQLPLYVIMGWCIIFAFQYVLACVEWYGVLLLVAGGITFTIGVPFYVIGEKTPIFHAIWHMFVLLGCAFHYFSVFLYVRPMSYIQTGDGTFTCVATQNATNYNWLTK